MKAVILKRLYILFACFVFPFYGNYLSAQSLLKEFDNLFLTGTEEAFLTKVATYTDKKMFFLSAEDLEFIPVFELKGEAIIKDSIPNVRIVTGEDRFHWTIPTSMIFSEGKLFTTYGYGIAEYERDDKAWFIKEVFPITDDIYNAKYHRIIGVCGNKVVIACDMYYNNPIEKYGDYTLAIYDLEEKRISRERVFNFDRAIFLNLYSFVNLFSCSKERISFLNPLKSEVYLLDYDLNVSDTLGFPSQDGYEATEKRLNELFTPEVILLCDKAPKNPVLILHQNLVFSKDNAYGLNTKQCFIDEDNLLIEYSLFGKGGAAEFFKLNLKTRQAERVFSYSYKEQPDLDDLIWKEELPIFNDGTYFKTTMKPSQDEENIVGGLDMYYCKPFDFRTK